MFKVGQVLGILAVLKSIIVLGALRDGFSINPPRCRASVRIQERRDFQAILTHEHRFIIVEDLEAENTNPEFPIGFAIYIE